MDLDPTTDNFALRVSRILFGPSTRDHPTCPGSQAQIRDPNLLRGNLFYRGTCYRIGHLHFPWGIRLTRIIHGFNTVDAADRGQAHTFWDDPHGILTDARSVVFQLASPQLLRLRSPLPTESSVRRDPIIMHNEW